MQNVMLQSTHKFMYRAKHMPDWVSWTVEEASEKTGYNQEYLRRLIRNKKIEAVKISRVFLIKRDSLLEYLKQTGSIEDGRYGPKK